MVLKFGFKHCKTKLAFFSMIINRNQVIFFQKNVHYLDVDNKFTICTAKLGDISLQWGII